MRSLSLGRGVMVAWLVATATPTVDAAHFAQGKAMEMAPKFSPSSRQIIT